MWEVCWEGLQHTPYDTLMLHGCLRFLGRTLLSSRWCTKDEQLDGYATQAFSSGHMLHQSSAWGHLPGAYQVLSKVFRVNSCMGFTVQVFGHTTERRLLPGHSGWLGGAQAVPKRHTCRSLANWGSWAGSYRSWARCQGYTAGWDLLFRSSAHTHLDFF